MSEQRKIMYDSPEAATYVENVKGWVDTNRHFFGDGPEGEHRARYSSHTHKMCECGKEMEKGWLKCESCRAKDARERFYSLPHIEWDGETPVCLAFGDKYFFSEEDLCDYIAMENEDLDGEDKITEVDLYICETNKYRYLDAGYWDDTLIEDAEVPKELEQAIEQLNKVLDTLPPASYSPSKIRTSYKYDESNN